jgi:hypothetical protein
MSEYLGPQPFGHEYGYLCFRIVVLAIGVSIISRDRRKYGIIISKLIKNERLEDLSVMLMDYVVGAVSEQIYGPWVSPDSFLGWSSRDSLAPIVSKANALLLLDILWKDRKGLLRAWAETHAPGLSGVLFILWRCVQITRYVDIAISINLNAQQSKYAGSMGILLRDTLAILHCCRNRSPWPTRKFQ